MKTTQRFSSILALVSALLLTPVCGALGDYVATFVFGYPGIPGVIYISILLPCHCQTNACADYADPPGCEDSGASPTQITGPAPVSLGGCGSCGLSPGVGMPTWNVSEPYINLRLSDAPLGYQPAHGLPVDFRLSYRQRGAVDDDAGIYGVGTNWSCSLRAYLVNLTNSTPGLMRLHRGGAGWVDYTVGAAQFREGSILTTATGTNIIEHPDGAKDYFQKSYTNGAGTIYYFLTAQADPAGNTTTFNYATNAGVVRLSSVVDADGLTTLLSYGDATFTNQITQVVDPFNHTNSLRYDPGGFLTNIVDVAGLASSFAYDASSRRGWITNMATPYGNTGFRYGGFEAESNRFDTITNSANRFIEVTQPDGGQHLWLYRQDCTNILSASYSPVPVTTPLSNTFDDQDAQERNSFYWGPLQHGHLSSAYLATGDVNALTNADYTLARLSHWLIDLALVEASSVLSLQRAPSPDGVTSGQITWYDYDGKLFGRPNLSSTSAAGGLRSFIALVLPDGTTRFTHYARNSRGLVTQEISTYSLADGSVGLRTNSYLYATNDVDMVLFNGPKGEQVVSNYFNANHQVLASYDALNQPTSSTYDSTTHLLTSRKTPGGLTKTNFYDGSQRLQTSIDLEINRTNAYTWTNGQVFTHTDDRGLTVTNAWDQLRRLTNVAFPDGSSMRYVYSNLDLVQVIDRMGFTKKFTYNPMRQRTSVTDPRTNVTGYAYCSCGSLDYITNALDQVTHFVYDNQGKLTQIFSPDGYNVTNSFDLPGQLITTSEGQGSTTNWFNNQGLLLASSNAMGRVQSIVFDIEDRRTTTVDANSMSNSQTFDDLGRILTRTYPDGGTESFGYSSRGLIAYTNQLTNVTFYAYDPAARKTAETNANNELTQFSYSAAGDLLTLTDGKTNVTTWNFDQYGRVTNKIDSATNVIFAYTYDPNNRLTNRWTPAKTNTVYKYDGAGNLSNITYAASHSIAMAYDAVSRLTNMVDAVGTSAYAFTSGGLLQSEDEPWANDTVSYAYNNRLRTGLNLSQPNASDWVQSYGYDPAKRLKTLASPAGTFTYDYDDTAHRLVKKLSLPNGAYITNAYDSVSRILSTVLKNSTNGILNSHSYAYNVGNQRTCLTNTFGDYENYGYDKNGQLTLARGFESNSSAREHEKAGYAYDAAGNLMRRTNNAMVETFNVNGLNELTTGSRSGTLTVAGTTTSTATNATVNSTTATRYSDNTFTASGFTLSDGTNTFTAVAKDNVGRTDSNSISAYLPASPGFTYDLNGNLLSDGRRAFDYDDENQLTRVTVTNSFKSEFSYDGKMRRRIRREYAWQLGAWRLTNEVHYVYDGNIVIQERDGLNLPSLAYTRGKDLSGSLEGAGGIGGLLAVSDLKSSISNPSHYFYEADGNGNVTIVINSLQLPVAKYLYDAFGGALSCSGVLAAMNVYGFSSKETHSPSDLVYHLYRYYDPGLQRWLSRDPLSSQATPYTSESASLRVRPKARESGVGAYRLGGSGWWLPRQRPPSLVSVPPAASSLPTGLAASAPTTFEIGNECNLYRFAWNSPLSFTDPYGLIPIDGPCVMWGLRDSQNPTPAWLCFVDCAALGTTLYVAGIATGRIPTDAGTFAGTVVTIFAACALGCGYL